MVELHDLGNQVFAVTGLFHPSGRGVNAGFLFSARTRVHIDSGMTVANGQQLLEFSKDKAKGEDKLLLLLTHHHSDHIFGMRAFKEAGARVIAHQKVDQFLSFRTPPLFKPALNTYKPFTVKRLVHTYSYDKKKAEETLGDVKLFYPDQNFKDDLILQIDGDELHLLCTPGHVPSEASFYHPKSKTLFAGDAVYEGMPLTTRYGGPKEWEQWIQSLEKLNELDVEKIVPGHGHICGKEEIQRNIDFLSDLLSEQSHR